MRGRDLHVQVHHGGKERRLASPLVIGPVAVGNEPQPVDQEREIVQHGCHQCQAPRGSQADRREVGIPVIDFPEPAARNHVLVGKRNQCGVLRRAFRRPHQMVPVRVQMPLERFVGAEPGVRPRCRTLETGFDEFGKTERFLVFCAFMGGSNFGEVRVRDAIHEGLGIGKDCRLLDVVKEGAKIHPGPIGFLGSGYTRRNADCCHQHRRPRDRVTETHPHDPGSSNACQFIAATARTNSFDGTTFAAWASARRFSWHCSIQDADVGVVNFIANVGDAETNGFEQAGADLHHYGPGGPAHHHHPAENVRAAVANTVRLKIRGTTRWRVRRAWMQSRAWRLSKFFDDPGKALNQVER